MGEARELLAAIHPDLVESLVMNSKCVISQSQPASEDTRYPGTRELGALGLHCSRGMCLQVQPPRIPWERLGS
jgi:hypothetical protein